MCSCLLVLGCGCGLPDDSDRDYEKGNEDNYVSMEQLTESQLIDAPPAPYGAPAPVYRAPPNIQVGGDRPSFYVPKHM